MEQEKPKQQAKQAKKLDAETRANRWLADGNAAMEAGHFERAEKCYAKSQYWLDRYSKLTENE